MKEFLDASPFKKVAEHIVNEIQKLHMTIEELTDKNKELERRNLKLEDFLREIGEELDGRIWDLSSLEGVLLHEIELRAKEVLK